MVSFLTKDNRLSFVAKYLMNNLNANCSKVVGYFSTVIILLRRSLVAEEFERTSSNDDDVLRTYVGIYLAVSGN